jgi:hypothetical protein
VVYCSSKGVASEYIGPDAGGCKVEFGEDIELGKGGRRYTALYTYIRKYEMHEDCIISHLCPSFSRDCF